MGEGGRRAGADERQKSIRIVELERRYFFSSARTMVLRASALEHKRDESCEHHMSIAHMKTAFMRKNKTKSGAG